MNQQLTALKDFTDRQGTQRRKGETFTAQNDQEAQDYIRNGQASASQEQPAR